MIGPPAPPVQGNGGPNPFRVSWLPPVSSKGVPVSRFLPVIAVALLMGSSLASAQAPSALRASSTVSPDFALTVMLVGVPSEA